MHVDGTGGVGRFSGILLVFSLGAASWRGDALSKSGAHGAGLGSLYLLRGVTKSYGSCHSDGAFGFVHGIPRFEESTGEAHVDRSLYVADMALRIHDGCSSL